MIGRPVSLAWFSLLLAPLAVSCAADSPRVPRGWAAEEVQIRTLLEESIAAWNRGDIDGHLAIYAASVTVMTENGPRPGIDPIRASFSEAYFRDGKPLQSLQAEQVAVRPVGKVAALMTGRFRLRGGDLPDRTGWFTLVWQHTKAGWRAIHDHTR